MATMRREAPDGQHVYTVSEFSQVLKTVMEETFPQIWVAGEISNFSQPQSGHCYFTLKDDQAQLKAVVWKSSLARVPFKLKDGQSVVCRGRLDVYPPRGAYQIIVDHLIPQGMGALELALQQLKEKLAKEGLFDPRRKRPLPRFPRRVAFVTSPTGAAVRDFLEVLRRRWRGVNVLIAPAKVQGEGAAKEIVKAIELVNRLSPPVDVLVVGRGGGSLEDLWAFNEEPVVRAVAASKVVTVSAVGHEIDVTLCDLAADIRALTPSEAAERIAPSAEQISALLSDVEVRLSASVRRTVERCRREVEFLAKSPALRRPFDRIMLERQRLDEWSAKAARLLWKRLQNDQQALALAAGKLHGLSPLQTLARGYSLCERDDGALVSSALELQPGDVVRTRFADSQAVSQITSTERLP